MRLGGRSCETSGEQMPLQYARSMTNRSYISRHLRYHLYIQDAVRVGPELFSVFSRGAHTECWAILAFFIMLELRIFANSEPVFANSEPVFANLEPKTTLHGKLKKLKFKATRRQTLYRRCLTKLASTRVWSWSLGYIGRWELS